MKYHLFGIKLDLHILRDNQHSTTSSSKSSPFVFPHVWALVIFDLMVSVGIYYHHFSWVLVKFRIRYSDIVWVAGLLKGWMQLCSLF